MRDATSVGKPLTPTSSAAHVAPLAGRRSFEEPTTNVGGRSQPVGKGCRVAEVSRVVRARSALPYPSTLPSLFACRCLEAVLVLASSRSLSVEGVGVWMFALSTEGGSACPCRVTGRERRPREGRSSARRGCECTGVETCAVEEEAEAMNAGVRYHLTELR